MSNSYTSIKSVLFDLSTVIDEQFWDPNKMLEWSIKGYRKMNLHSKYELAGGFITVLEHKAKLPEDLKYIIQVANVPTENITDEELIEELTRIVGDPSNTLVLSSAISDGVYNSMSYWQTMLPNKSTLASSIYCQNENLALTLQQCNYTYDVSPSNVLTTNLKNGIIYVSYLRYISDVDGDTLVPDDETIKEAITHYCLYRYWLSKSMMGDTFAERQRDWNLARYQLLSAKGAANLNIPDVGTMEGLLNMRLSLKGNTKSFSNFFMDINTDNNTSYV